MGPLDALWHLLNFLVPALGVAVLAASMAKFIWHREMAAVAWSRLVLWAAGAGVIVLIAGLVVFGRDGKMVTYVALVAACALALWWVGFIRR